MIDVGKNELLTDQIQKVAKDLDALRMESSSYKDEKDDLVGKLKMVHIELESTKATIECMNTGSMKLDEILERQKTDLLKTGIGYIHRASTSKEKVKSFFGSRTYYVLCGAHYS